MDQIGQNLKDLLLIDIDLDLFRHKIFQDLEIFIFYDIFEILDHFVRYFYNIATFTM